MEPSARRKLLAVYSSGYQQLANSLVGITDRELDTRPRPDAWSPREIVHHLADAELVGSVRLRRILAEDGPEIRPYDQDEFSRRLRYDRPLTASLELFRALRAANTSLLELLRAEDWQRTGNHLEAGTLSVERWLEIYAEHAARHARQILDAREATR